MHGDEVVRQKQWLVKVAETNGNVKEDEDREPQWRTSWKAYQDEEKCLELGKHQRFPLLKLGRV